MIIITSMIISIMNLIMIIIEARGSGARGPGPRVGARGSGGPAARGGRPGVAAWGSGDRRGRCSRSRRREKNQDERGVTSLRLCVCARLSVQSGCPSGT